MAEFGMLFNKPSFAVLFLLALALFPPGFSAQAQREPVLKQVDVPHSYYWREMYVPQLTSGPSALSWTPDGKSLIYSMQGRIWRQRIGSTRAEQLTNGGGYEFQPDVSPDGRRVVFARYENDAIELVILDLRTFGETRVTSNGAVNLEPRWSPDGKRIAFVTTDETGRFHIALAEARGEGWSIARWRPERRSKTPRYYYDAVDHELSPIWTPDGQSLVFVANPETGYGTGAIFRQRVDLSEPAPALQTEETAWKARPDISPDGKRLAYSSYLGRQWHQLWMTTVKEGGYPTPFSYGDFDITGVRWSPSGGQAAYISNETGDGAIWIQETVGGGRQKLTVDSRKYRGAMGALEFAILGPEGAPAASRISIRAADGRDYAPDDALIHADDSFDRSAAAVETHYFHTAGSGVVNLPPGAATVRVWRGLGTAPQTKIVNVRQGETSRVEIDLEPVGLANEFEKWTSGDVHVHMNYGGAYRMTPQMLASQADAEDLDVVFNLVVNKEQRIPDIAYFSPVPSRPEGAQAIIVPAQEFHTSVWGHMGLLGLEDHFLIPDYVGYPNTALHSLYPDNATVADRAREQGALVGYVHPFDAPAPDPVAEGRLTHALPVEAALGKLDYIEVLGFSDHRTTESVWRRLLNCGFRIAAAGGTDAMTNFASLRGPVGLNRTYVKMDANGGSAKAATQRWLDGLKAGNSFATNGPLLLLDIAGAGPGEEIRLGRGVHKLSVHVTMASIAPVDALELVFNGEVAAKIPLMEDGRAAEYSGEFEVKESGWISLRASSEKASPLIFDAYPFAVTTPVYVTIAGQPLRSEADADYFIAWIDKLRAFAAESEAYNTEAERKAVLNHLAAARREFKRRR